MYGSHLGTIFSLAKPFEVLNIKWLQGADPLSRSLRRVHSLSDGTTDLSLGLLAFVSCRQQLPIFFRFEWKRL